MMSSFTFTFAVHQQKVTEENITESNRNSQLKTASETYTARDDQLIMYRTIFPYLASSPGENRDPRGILRNIAEWSHSLLLHPAGELSRSSLLCGSPNWARILEQSSNKTRNREFLLLRPLSMSPGPLPWKNDLTRKGKR